MYRKFQLLILMIKKLWKIKCLIWKLFENYTSQNILMNITGGTKLMAISAYSVFSANDSVCAYFVERSNELVYLDQAGQKFVLEPKLKIKDILLAHGYELVGKPLQQLPMNKPHLTRVGSRRLRFGDFGYQRCDIG